MVDYLLFFNLWKTSTCKSPGFTVVLVVAISVFVDASFTRRTLEMIPCLLIWHQYLASAGVLPFRHD